MSDPTWNVQCNRAWTPVSHVSKQIVNDPKTKERYRSLVDGCRPGYSLPQVFYGDPDLHRFDLDFVWKKTWLFAGHSCEAARPGDFFTLLCENEPLLIVRDSDGRIRCYYNVCRHRGSLLCSESSGHARRIVCPYHQWSYGTDGQLISTWGMQEDLDKTKLGLMEVHAREVGGLIFVCLAPEPPDFDGAFKALAPMLKPQGLVNAKIAHIEDYQVNANWKLVWENNRECYHCNRNHPQYIRANFDHYNTDDTSEDVRNRMNQLSAESESLWSQSGLLLSHKETGMTPFPDAEHNIWYSINRTILSEGYCSETMDGKQVAPLMGDYHSKDVGTLRMRTLPNFWNHSSCDHGVSTRLLPMGPASTLIRVYWLVDAQAREGIDYQLDTLLPFWKLTSEQDWKICERQQIGVNSSGYRPGPYSVYKEYNVDSFIQWYLKTLKKDFAHE